MIYGIAGASGTGKTTLGQSVGEALSIPFVRTSITDMARKAGFNAVGRLELHERLALQESLLEQFEELLLKTKGPVIFDRTPLDLIGYLGAEVHMHSHGELTMSDLHKIDAYFTRCQELTSRSFDQVFVTSILPHYEEVETRPGFNPAYQRHVQFLIMGSIFEGDCDLSVSILSTDDLQDRISIMSETIVTRLDQIEMEKRKNRHLH